MIRIVLFLLSACLVVGCGAKDVGPWPGPFGTKKGITAQQLEKYAVLERLSESNGQVTYQSPQAPDMSGGASNYYYIVGNNSGLCMASASVPDVRNSGSMLADSYMKKFGRPEKDESADWGVIWDSSKFKIGDDLRSIRMVFSGTEPSVDAIIQASYIPAADCH